MVKNTCEKCEGKGHIPAYNHIENGKCFTCDGRGWHRESEKTTKKEIGTKQYKEQKITNDHYELLINDIEVAEVWKENNKWFIEGINENGNYKTGIHSQGTKKEIIKLFMKKYFKAV